jgi:hypothetical protein
VETTLWDLTNERASSKRTRTPIIILAYSIWGSVAKALWAASSRKHDVEARQLHDSIMGFMFFGTLHHGNYSEDVQRGHKLANRTLRRVDRRSLEALPSNMVRKAPIINDDWESKGGAEIPAVCFFETKPTRSFRPFKVFDMIRPYSVC